MLGKYLDINTSHLKEETLNSLSENKIPYSYHYPEGVFIVVPMKIEIEGLKGIVPNDLLILLNYAWRNGAKMIRLDADAEVDSELPVYEWNEPSENEKLAEKIISFFYNYENEECKKEIIENLESELDVTSYYIIDVIKKLCERIGGLEG